MSTKKIIKKRIVMKKYFVISSNLRTFTQNQTTVLNCTIYSQKIFVVKTPWIRIAFLWNVLDRSNAVEFGRNHRTGWLQWLNIRLRSILASSERSCRLRFLSNNNGTNVEGPIRIRNPRYEKCKSLINYAV